MSSRRGGSRVFQCVRSETGATPRFTCTAPVTFKVPGTGADAQLFALRGAIESLTGKVATARLNNLRDAVGYIATPTIKGTAAATTVTCQGALHAS